MGHLLPPTTPHQPPQTTLPLPQILGIPSSNTTTENGQGLGAVLLGVRWDERGGGGGEVVTVDSVRHQEPRRKLHPDLAVKADPKTVI